MHRKMIIWLDEAVYEGIYRQPFKGLCAHGLLCVQSPTIRTGVHSTAGNVNGVDCSGWLSFAFNTYVASGRKSGADQRRDGVDAVLESRRRLRGRHDLTDALTFALCAP